MARATNKLSAIGIDKLKGRGRFGDGGGLWLNISASDTKSWVFRWTVNKKPREMGLGPYPAVSLAAARNRAFEYRKMVANGLNPKTECDRQEGKTFGEAADTFFEVMKSRWTNEKSRHQWKITLTDYCAPIRSTPVADIETSHVLNILNPIWNVKAETASRIRMRIENVLDFAKSNGWREGENPARWRGHLANTLPARQKLQKGHHAAMEYGDIPRFANRLRGLEAMAARALEFLILTVGRTSEVLNAEWSEIDFDTGLWIVPAHRMHHKT